MSEYAGKAIRLADIEAAMTEVYVGRSIEDLTGNCSTSYKKIKNGNKDKDVVELNSRGASIVARVRNNVSESLNNAEFANFPSAGKSQLYKFNIPARTMMATCLFSGKALAEENMSSALANAIRGDIDNKLDNLANSLNLYVWGDGSGERARVGSVSYLSTVATVVCNNSGSLHGTQYLEEGMEVEFRAANGTLRNTGSTFATIATTNNGTVTFVTETGAPTDVQAGDRVYLRGSYNQAMWGVLYHLSNTGSWQGLSNRTLYKNTSAPVINAGGDALSPALIDKIDASQAFKRGDMNGGSGEYYASSQFFAYKQISYEIRVTESSDQFDGGVKRISHGGTPINFERDVPRDAFARVDFGEMKRLEMKGLGMEKDPRTGSYFHLINASSGQMHADGRAVYFKAYMNWASRNPNKLGARIYGLSTTGLNLGNDT